MKRSFHSRASRVVRSRRQSAARRSVALSGERFSLGSFVMHSAREAQVAVAALQALAQREGHLCMNTSTAYTVKHIQTPLAFANSRVKNAKGDWDIMIMNGNAHSGEEWKEWKKNNGKTETDPELW